jgi:hypothetical protein
MSRDSRRRWSASEQWISGDARYERYMEVVTAAEIVAIVAMRNGAESDMCSKEMCGRGTVIEIRFHLSYPSAGHHVRHR